MDKLKQLLKNEKIAPLVQFVKFGIVGVSNTAISYGIDLLCFYVLFAKAEFVSLISLLSSMGITTQAETLKTVFASILAFVISVTNSYYWNNRYVFSSGEKTFSEHLKSYFKTVICYGVTGLVLSPAIKVVLKNMGIPYYIASLGSLVVTIPLNFLLNKFWAFKAKPKEREIKDENKIG